MTESVKLEPIGWLCVGPDNEREFEHALVGDPWREPLMDGDREAGWSATPLFARHQSQQREAVLEQALTKISDMGDAEIYANPAAVKRLVRDALATPAPAVSTEEIVAVFDESLPEQAARLGVRPNRVESPGHWRDRVRKAAILSRLRGERE